MYRLVDLFAGTGAFSWAFMQTGRVVPVFSNDLEQSSKRQYDLNFKHPLTLGDLHEIPTGDIPAHDILTMGLPCQPFSVAGQKGGFSDGRSHVFYKVVDIIRHHRPRFVLMENVRNLLTHNGGSSLATITDQLSGLGYTCTYAVLDTARVTEIPQHRERIYIVACRDGEQFDLSFSTHVEPKAVCDLMSSEEVAKRYYYSDRFRVWQTVLDGVTEHIETNAVYQLRMFRTHYIRRNKKQQCPTLMANMGSGGHNVPLIRDDTGIRKLTPRECFNLQGFPSHYKLDANLPDSALYRLAGNAVSVPVVQLIANRLLEQFPPHVKF